jgi:Ni,Fe-hydrogenase III small subunit
MAYSIVLTLVVFGLVYLSMNARVRQIAQARKRSYEEASSPLSEAIKDFVAVAGGVYLGLMALSEFLKVPVPIEAEVWGLSFDPIAVVAVVLAIVAPMFPGRNRY